MGLDELSKARNLKVKTQTSKTGPESSKNK